MNCVSREMKARREERARLLFFPHLLFLLSFFYFSHIYILTHYIEIFLNCPCMLKSHVGNSHVGISTRVLESIEKIWSQVLIECLKVLESVGHMTLGKYRCFLNCMHYFLKSSRCGDHNDPCL